MSPAPHLPLPMTIDLHPQLADRLQRHARALFRIACGLGRQSDGEDIVQTLYTRWWRRLRDEPGWELPESRAELFVSVRRVVIDVSTRERRERQRHLDAAGIVPEGSSPDESLHAFERLQWILTRLPEPLAEALIASLSAGRRDDAAVAEELGVTTSAFTARLFKARRAAEELAGYYELLSHDQAALMAALRYSGKSRTQIARELGLLPDDLQTRSEQALDALAKHRRVAS